MTKRKTFDVLVRVTAPADFTSREIAREVRTLVNDQCNYDADPGDIRARTCRAARAPQPKKGATEQ